MGDTTKVLPQVITSISRPWSGSNIPSELRPSTHIRGTRYILCSSTYSSHRRHREQMYLIPQTEAPE